MLCIKADKLISPSFVSHPKSLVHVISNALSKFLVVASSIVSTTIIFPWNGMAVVMWRQPVVPNSYKCVCVVVDITGWSRWMVRILGGSKYQMYYFWRLGKHLDFSEMTISKILPIHLNHPVPLLPQKEASRSGDRLHKRRLKNFFGLSQNRRGQGSWNELLPSSRAALYICQKNGRKSPQKCNLRLVNGLFIIILTNFQNF